MQQYISETPARAILFMISFRSHYEETGFCSMMIINFNGRCNNLHPSGYINLTVFNLISRCLRSIYQAAQAV
jgi:hypothetical protein